MRVATETRSAELESYLLPGVTLTGSRCECVAQIDEVIRGLLCLRRHLVGDERRHVVDFVDKGRRQVTP